MRGCPWDSTNEEKLSRLWSALSHRVKSLRESIRNAVRPLLLWQAGIENPLPRRVLCQIMEDISKAADPDVAISQRGKLVCKLISGGCTAGQRPADSLDSVKDRCWRRAAIPPAERLVGDMRLRLSSGHRWTGGQMPGPRHEARALFGSLGEGYEAQIFRPQFRDGLERCFRVLCFIRMRCKGG